MNKLSIMTVLFLNLAGCSKFEDGNASKKEIVANAGSSSDCQHHLQYYGITNKIDKIYSAPTEIPIPVANGGYAGFCYESTTGITGSKTEEFFVPEVKEDTCVTSPGGPRARGWSSLHGSKECDQNVENRMEAYTLLELDESNHVVQRFPLNSFDYLWLRADKKYKFELVTDFSKNPSYAHCSSYSAIIMLSKPMPEGMYLCPSK